MRQLERFSVLRSKIAARRYSLANSAGICLGHDYAFDLTRPGLALYGGIPRAEARGHIAQVAFPEAQILQRKTALAGEGIGYNATRTAARGQRQAAGRSEEHTSELQSLMRISYAVICLKKQNTN